MNEIPLTLILQRSILWSHSSKLFHISTVLKDESHVGAYFPQEAIELSAGGTFPWWLSVFGDLYPILDGILLTHLRSI